MGHRGPPPKPTALRIIEGNPGKRPLNYAEPLPRQVSPIMPRLVRDDPDARRAWRRVVPELRRLGLLTVVDTLALELACLAYANAVQCEEVIRTKGRTVKTPSGYVQQRPEVSIGLKAAIAYRGFCHEFGLTPAGRAQLSSPERGQDELDALLG